MSSCCVLHGALCDVIDYTWRAVSGLNEQLLCLRFKDVIMNGNFLETDADIRLNIFSKPGFHLDAKSEPGKKRLVYTEKKPGHKCFITHHKQAERSLGIGAIGSQETYFFHGSYREVLGFLNDEDRPGRGKVLPHFA
jgi:hypothetical protein